MSSRSTGWTDPLLSSAPSIYNKEFLGMSKSVTPELREKILKDGTVRFAGGTFKQKYYSNGTASEVDHSVQDIVEIGIDHLMELIDQAITEKLGEVVAGLPTSGTNLNRGATPSQYTQGFVEGFNQAVTEVEALLRDKMEGKK